MSEQPAGTLEVGRVGRPHGVRGEVYVSLTTDRDERVAVGSRLHARGAWHEVEWSQAANGRWLVSFAGVHDRTAAERLTGAALYAEPLDDPDALWVHDLIGSRVVEVDGTDRGTCIAVIDNPAADLLELDGGALVPMTFVLSHDEGTIRIDPPAGLFD